MRKPKLAGISGSSRTAPKGSKKLTKADDQQTIEVTLRLRSKTPPEKLDRMAANLGKLPPGKRRYLTREELEDKYGAAPADVRKVERFAHDAGLTVARVHYSSRVVKLQGAVNSFRKAFGVNLKKVEQKGKTYRVRQGEVSLPPALKNIVVGVHGLDNRPVARPHFRKRAGVKPRNASDGSLSVGEIAKAYNFPSGLDGTGQTIAIIELNGIDKNGKSIDTGYDVSDLKAFFKKNRLPYPEITSVGVNGGANLPGKANGGDDEVVLDIEIAGAVAPGAKIVVYFAPNTTNGFIDVLKAAVHDSVRKPSIISISWGGTEDPGGHMSPAYMDALSETFRDASLVGVTVCVAAGDDGSADMSDGWDGKPHVDFPSSSPYALACGGTKLTTSRGKIKNEIVWNEGDRGASGGGVSNYFGKPDYQKSANVPLSPKKKRGRGVPDVTGVGDPNTGYRIFFERKPLVIGGTSAVAPLMGGLLALINQRLSKKSANTAGFINPLIYGASGRTAFRDITEGNNDADGSLNGTYSARVGWDACSGLGVADGTKLLNLLT